MFYFIGVFFLPPLEPAMILAMYICHTFVALACKSHEIMNGIVVIIHNFFLPNLSIKGPIKKEPSGSAMFTMLAGKITISVFPKEVCI